MNKILADMHTHTIASGHAYATLTEMCKEAANKGLEIYGITEHSSGIPGTCADIYFQNLRVVPRDLFVHRFFLLYTSFIYDYTDCCVLRTPTILPLNIRIL